VFGFAVQPVVDKRTRPIFAGLLVGVMIQEGTHLLWFDGHSLLRPAGAVMLTIGATIVVYAIARDVTAS
jgi:hypothetical protein